jgi:hypothetical protein
VFGRFSVLIHCAANKQINQDKKQLVFAPASPILTNYFLPIIWALVNMDHIK